MLHTDPLHTLAIHFPSKLCCSKMYQAKQGHVCPCMQACGVLPMTPSRMFAVQNLFPTGERGLPGSAVAQTYHPLARSITRNTEYMFELCMARACKPFPVSPLWKHNFLPYSSLKIPVHHCLFALLFVSSLSTFLGHGGPDSSVGKGRAHLRPTYQ